MRSWRREACGECPASPIANKCKDRRSEMLVALHMAMWAQQGNGSRQSEGLHRPSCHNAINEVIRIHQQGSTATKRPPDTGPG